MNKKQYITPRTEVLAVRVEKCLQALSIGGGPQTEAV